MFFEIIERHGSPGSARATSRRCSRRSSASRPSAAICKGLCAVTVRLRSAMSALPAYVPGRKTPGAIVLASNESPYGLLPVGRGDDRRGSPAGVSRYPDMTSTRADRGDRRAPRCRRRSGSRSAPAASRWSARSPPPSSTRATRSSSAGGPSRPTRSSPRSSAASAVQGAAARRRSTTSTPWRPRSPTATRLVLRLQRQQPDRYGGRRGELTRLRRRSPRRCARRDRRGLPPLRRPGRRARRARRCSATGRTSSSPAPSPRPTRWPACGSATASARPMSSRRRARRRCRSASAASRRSAPSPRLATTAEVDAGLRSPSPNATGSRKELAAAGLRRPAVAGQLRLAAARRRRPPRLPQHCEAGGVHRPAVRGRRRAGHDRPARGERRVPRPRVGVVGLALT